ncbi:ABC transporter permease [Sporanaerobium hydrogeniformans]|uniref:ABC transporter permease n=1 Tax=Sporanaerobium hydrogeniformans TaxID=3072179 RepID=A0AC61D6J6_9FIRM|nr:sugar ABC transporter permease [Sporanaerobium hydrogeniformans]PHV69349.1 ABC transporter permease [Sporanaerobium hydrogeniformans]
MEKVWGDKKAILFFLFPSFVILALIIITPIMMSSYYSLLDWDGFGKGTFIGLNNYIRLFKDPAFIKSVRNSLVFAFASIAIQLPISLLLALVLAKGVKYERFFVTVYFIPVIISTVVIGQLWMKIYHPEYGLLNMFLKTVGLESVTREWLGDTKTALIASVVPVLWQYIGYHMLLLYAGIKSISTDVFEAAKIDGATWGKTCIHITIPMLKPILKVSFTFAVVGALKVFDLVYVLTRGGPARASEVTSTLMVETIFKSNSYGYGSAMAVFVVVECLVLYLVIGKLFKEEV